MTLLQYLELKRERIRLAWSPRADCAQCRKPQLACYCRFIRPFPSSPEFVILIHKKEARKSIATGRMSHLCLTNSLLIEGSDFSNHPRVNSIINDPQVYPVVLFPSQNSTNLTPLSPAQRRSCFPTDKRLVVFVIDGTWAQAKRMKRLSTNLKALPTICFTVPAPSKFWVRKQPHGQCYSTIEAIHHLIELLGPENSERHANLLEVFDIMVSKQLSYGHQRLVRSGT